MLLYGVCCGFGFDLIVFCFGVVCWLACAFIWFAGYVVVLTAAGLLLIDFWDLLVWYLLLFGGFCVDLLTWMFR